MPVASVSIPIRRYGASRARDRDCKEWRGVGSSALAAYVAGIVHRWDLRRPSLSGSACLWRCHDGRRNCLNFPRPHPAGARRCGAARARRFLAGYRGLTREAYSLDLRQFTGWCRARSLPLFSVRRADIETFARELEARGRAPGNRLTRRLSTIAGFCRYAVEGELLDYSPAAHVRRPRLDYESHASALDRSEVGALLVAAGLGPAAEHALISLLALNGLRVSEITGADIEHLGLERGHRTLVITRKGGKVVTIPLAPRTARAIDLATGERTDGPLFVTADGRRLDRHGAARIVRRVTRRAGIGKHVGPHTLRHAFITAALDAGVRFAICRRPPLMPTRAKRAKLHQMQLSAGCGNWHFRRPARCFPKLGPVSQRT